MKLVIGGCKKNNNIFHVNIHSLYNISAATVGICFNSVVPSYSNRYYETWSCTAQVSPLGYPWLPAHL